MTSSTTAENKVDFPEEILRQNLQRMYPRIASCLDPKGAILDTLFANGTITIQEKRRIARMSEGRGAELIDMLLTCQRPNAVSQFLEILFLSEETAWKWIPDEVFKVASTLTSPLGIDLSSVQTRQGIKSTQSTLMQANYDPVTKYLGEQPGNGR